MNTADLAKNEGRIPALCPGLISVVAAIPQPQLPGATSVPVKPASGAQFVRTYTPTDIINDRQLT